MAVMNELRDRPSKSPRQSLPAVRSRWSESRRRARPPLPNLANTPSISSCFVTSMLMIRPPPSSGASFLDALFHRLAGVGEGKRGTFAFERLADAVGDGAVGQQPVSRIFYLAGWAWDPLDCAGIVRKAQLRRISRYQVVGLQTAFCLNRAMHVFRSARRFALVRSTGACGNVPIAGDTPATS